MANRTLRLRVPAASGWGLAASETLRLFKEEHGITGTNSVEHDLPDKDGWATKEWTM